MALAGEKPTEEGSANKITELNAELIKLEEQNKELEGSKAKLQQELADLATKLADKDQAFLSAPSEDDKYRQQALLLKQQLDDQKNSLDSQGRVLDGVKRQNESLSEQLKKKSNDLITLLAESGDENGFKREIVQLKSSLDELQVEVERRKSAENELRLKFENELEKIKMSNNTLAVERSDMESSLLKSESDNKLLQKENTRLSLELQNTIQKGEEAQLRSVECMRKMEEKLVEAKGQNEKISEQFDTTKRILFDLNIRLTKSEEEKNSLQREFTKLTLKSDKLERGDLQKLKDDIAKINNTNQELSGRDKSPEEALRAENPRENKPITVASKNTFDLLVNNFIVDNIVEKPFTKQSLTEFVILNPSILHLKSNVVPVVEQGLFEYFFEMLMKCTEDENSNIDEVINLKKCASVFLARPASLSELMKWLKDYFFRVLDDLVIAKAGKEEEFTKTFELAIKNLPEEGILSNQTEYLTQRLYYYYQTYFNESSNPNLDRLEGFFSGLKDKFQWYKLYKLVPSAKEMFRRHMESSIN